MHAQCTVVDCNVRKALQIEDWTFLLVPAGLQTQVFNILAAAAS